MQLRRFLIDSLLAPYIEPIWAFETETGLPVNDIRTIVPSAKPKLIIPYRGTMSSSINTLTTEHLEGSITLVGMIDRSVVIDSGTVLGTLGIEFRPGAAYRFLDFPLREALNATYPLDAVLGKIGRALQQRIADAQTTEQKVRIVQDFLLHRLYAIANENPLIDHAVSLIQSSFGLIRIGELSKELGYSKQYMDRVFGEYIGFSPKMLARIVRFQQVYKRVRVQPSAEPFADDLFELYYDQARFAKEFKLFTGYSPLSYTRQHNEFARIFYLIG
jgi:AraC-like DNA-binding protein